VNVPAKATRRERRHVSCATQQQAVRLIESFRAMGCAEVLSEDPGDGQDYAGIRVTNPFR
jgi:hypothetical protein